MEATCPICSRKTATNAPPPRRERRAAAPAAPRPAGKRRAARSGSSEVVVRRVARAADDGYDSDLAPGLRATVEAARLADEIAFSAARLAELESEPPGLYAEVARSGDVEEALWLAFLIAYLSPLEGDDPFGEIERVRVPWATGELPDLDGAKVGPRSAHDPRRGPAGPAAYRAWAGRAGSQAQALAGEPGWSAERRFDRAFERLALPGFGSARYEMLVLVSRLGRADVRATSLPLGDAREPTTLAAKRVFGIGDALNLRRRARDLAYAAEVPVEALDLALVNWARAPEDRVTAGSRVVADEAQRLRLRALLDADVDTDADADADTDAERDAAV
jgi:hypothetical protein